MLMVTPSPSEMHRVTVNKSLDLRPQVLIQSNYAKRAVLRGVVRCFLPADHRGEVEYICMTSVRLWIKVRDYTCADLVERSPNPLKYLMSPLFEELLVPNADLPQHKYPISTFMNFNGPGVPYVRGM